MSEWLVCHKFYPVPTRSWRPEIKSLISRLALPFSSPTNPFSLSKDMSDTNRATRAYIMPAPVRCPKRNVRSKRTWRGVGNEFFVCRGILRLDRSQRHRVGSRKVRRNIRVRSDGTGRQFTRDWTAVITVS